MEKIDFDQLCKNAYASNAGLTEKDQLWIEVFKLEEWYFIPRGSLPELHPYVANADIIDSGTKWVYAFTDMNRATFFAKKNGLFMEDNSSPIMAVPNSEEILDWLNNYAKQGVKGIYFNAEGSGFYAPMSNLQSIKTHLQNTYPKELNA